MKCSTSQKSADSDWATQKEEGSYTRRTQVARKVQDWTLIDWHSGVQPIVSIETWSESEAASGKCTGPALPPCRERPPCSQERSSLALASAHRTVRLRFQLHHHHSAHMHTTFNLSALTSVDPPTCHARRTGTRKTRLALSTRVGNVRRPGFEIRTHTPVFYFDTRKRHSLHTWRVTATADEDFVPAQDSRACCCGSRLVRAHDTADGSPFHHRSVARRGKADQQMRLPGPCHNLAVEVKTVTWLGRPANLLTVRNQYAHVRSRAPALLLLLCA